MKTSIEGRVNLGGGECLTQTKYIDSGGVQTIGLGSTVSEVKNIKNIPWDEVWSVEKCVEVYSKSLLGYERAVNQGLKVPVKQHEFDVLVSFVYNLGVGANTYSVFRRINAGVRDLKVESKTNPRPGTIWEAFWRCRFDDGKVVQGLINRRYDEYCLFMSGIYPRGDYVDLVPVHPTTHKPIYSKGKKINLRNYLTS